jgi:DNA repair protein RadC
MTHATQTPEDLLRHGAPRLTDADILALLLQPGRSGPPATGLAGRLLARFGSLRAVMRAPEEEIARLRGAGAQAARHAARLTAAAELVRRALLEQARDEDVIASPDALRDFLRLTLADREREVFIAVYLDNRHRVIAVEELFQGTLTQTSVHPREVVRAALRHNAAAAIVAHNHPSGVAQASQADRTLTEQLRATLSHVDVRLLDHFIITPQAAISFAESGLI